MQVVTPELIQGKKVLLRLDIDVPIKNKTILDSFRLEAGFATIELCLEHAQKVVVMGHIGRPGGVEAKEFSVEPIHDWLEDKFGPDYLEGGKLCLMENLRFETGEETCDPVFAKELASFGDFFVNEAFAAYHPASSTTILPTLLPHAAGLRFVKEVGVLSEVRENPKKPMVAIIGGAKVEDKLPVVLALAKVADAVLVGGKLPQEIKDKDLQVPSNVFVGKLDEEGTDIAPETTDSWKNLIGTARMVVWNGPLGLVEDEKNDQTKVVARFVIDSKAKSIVGGGDTVSALDRWGLLDKFSFVSTGGGAMVKFLETGILPTIEALK